MKQVQVGDSVFSKNGMEFYCTVVEVKGSKVTVRYCDGNEEFYETVSKSLFRNWDPEGEDWDIPNWTFGFEIN
jgi:hypothetical protein